MTNEASARPHLDLDGRTAIVTGAGRGIGRAIALSLAHHGANVAIVARSETDLAEARRTIEEVGRRCCVISADLTDASACSRAVATAVADLGAPDILVNNVGAATFKPVWAYTADELDWHYNVNYRSMHVCTVEALAHMMPRRRGVIVNIASSSGKKPYRHQGPYCAMKAAVIALTRVLALELRDYGIRVHVVCPGAVDTAMADAVHPERDRTGWIQPDDVAQVVLDLLALPDRLTVDEVVMRRYLAEPM